MNKIIPFKNRKVDLSKPVEIYRNLNRKGKVYSIKQGQHVIGHTKSIALSSVRFVVNESGKARALATGRRNVHATIRGMIVKDQSKWNGKLLEDIRYMPFENGGFHIVRDCNKIFVEGAIICSIGQTGVSAAGVT